MVPTSIASHELPATTATATTVAFEVSLAARNLAVTTGTSVPVFYNIQ